MHLSYYTRALCIFIFIYVVFIYLITPLIIVEKSLVGDKFCGYSLSYIFEGKGYYYFYFRTQKQNIIVKTNKEFSLSLFDRLCIRGKYKKISSIPYFGNFNWARYMNLKNIFWELESDEIEFKKGFLFFKEISNLRYIFLKTIESNLDKDYSSIISGLVIGEKKSLSKEFKEYAVKCGIMHLMVASGSNISYFIFLLSYFFSFFGVSKRFSYAYALLITFFYVVLIGFEPPITRAYLMILLMFIFYFIKRNIDPLQILFGVFGLFILVNPVLLYDPSFIMSFLCVYGIIVGILNWGAFENIKIFSFNSSDNKRIVFLKKVFNKVFLLISAIFFITIFSQLILFVYISNNFYRFSLISLVSNIVLIPFSSVVVTLSLLSFIFLISLNINIFFVLGFITKFFLKLVYFFASFKYSSFFFSSYSFLNSLSIFLTVLVILHFKTLNLKLISTKVFLSFVFLFLFLSFLWKDIVREDIRFSFKNGKDSWYIERNGNFYLIDPIIEPQKVINSVFASRRNRIDYILVSSYDSMKINNIEKLKSIFDIKKVYIPLWLCIREEKIYCVFGGDSGDGFNIKFKDKYGYFNIYSSILFCFDDRCF